MEANERGNFIFAEADLFFECHMNSCARKAPHFFRVLLIIILAAASECFAALPVDIFQDMAGGLGGELLTPPLMNASSHGGPSTWTVHGQMWVSTNHSAGLPDPIILGNARYPGTSSTHGWMFNDANELNYAKCSLPGRYAKITVACYYATGVTIPWVQFDSITFIEATDKTWGVLQVETEDRGGPYLRCHSASTGGHTTYSPEHIKVVPGKFYWVNLHFDGDAGTVSGAVFDPANGFAQVGETMVANSTKGAQVYGSIRFGQTSAHGNHPEATTQSYFDHIVVDFSRAAFPLLPSPASH